MFHLGCYGRHFGEMLTFDNTALYSIMSFSFIDTLKQDILHNYTLLPIKWNL